jgi:histidinol-phosphate aminotransferase
MSMFARTPGPVDMALNHGTYCSPRALDVLRRHADRTSLRFYAPADDGALRAAIGRHAGVSAASILVANGSGPLLKSVIPYLIEQRIRASPARMVQHLLFRRGYPMIVTSPTYSKVPSGAVRNGLSFESIELDPRKGFALDPAELRARLRKRDGLAYLCSPNNPTGNLLLDRQGLEPLLAEFPRSFFFIDEAYVDYIAPERQPRLADLTARHDNLLILRSFSFAHGLAGAHIGYAITSPALVETMRARATPHLVGRLAAELAIASLEDPTHRA